MGSICGHYQLGRWRYEKLGKLKDDGREMGRVLIGYMDDYESYETFVYMLKEHYNGIKDGSIGYISHPYARADGEELELFKNGEKIQPIRRNNEIVY